MNLTREFTADLEIRSDGTGRTIHGIVVPFGQVASVSDGGRPYDEKFQRGAFTKTLAERNGPVRLLSQHNSSRPIGRAEEIREDGAGLYGAFKVSNTADGNDQLELVRDGVLGSFSVGFSPVKHVMDGATKVRTEVGLREVSLVTFPAYAGALVAGVRAADIAGHIETLDPDERAELARLIASATPLGEPAGQGTSDPEAATAEPPLGHSPRQFTPSEIRTMIRARIALKGIAS